MLRVIVSLGLALIFSTACSSDEERKANQKKSVSVSQPAKKKVAGYVKKSDGSNKKKTASKKSAELTAKNVSGSSCAELSNAIAFFYVAAKMTKLTAPKESASHEAQYRQLKNSYNKRCQS